MLSFNQALCLQLKVPFHIDLLLEIGHPLVDKTQNMTRMHVCTYANSMTSVATIILYRKRYIIISEMYSPIWPYVAHIALQALHCTA